MLILIQTKLKAGHYARVTFEQLKNAITETEMVRKTFTYWKHCLHGVSDRRAGLHMTTFANPYSLINLPAMICNLTLTLRKMEHFSILLHHLF